MMAVPTCIYCRRTGPDVVFNREHVIPEAFGKFKDNLVLQHIVCEDCNTEFGKTIDFVLGRGSVEAVFRLQRNLKAPKESREVGLHRVILEYPEPGDWNGVLLELTEQGGKAVVLPIPQAWLPLRDPVGVVKVSLQQLRSPESRKPDRFDPDGRIKIFAPSGEAAKHVTTAVTSQGIPFEPHGELEDPSFGDAEMPVRVSFLIDDLVMRAIREDRIQLPRLAGRRGARSGF